MNGQGIVKVDSFPIFVKNMLVNEVGKVKIIKVLKNYAVGRLIEIYEASLIDKSHYVPYF